MKSSIFCKPKWLLHLYQLKMVFLSKQKILCLFFVQLFCFCTYAQTIVKGIIKNQAGDILQGVNISVKGKSVGTTTDYKGNYSISVESSKDVLIYSSIGYISQEIQVNNQEKLDIILIENSQKLSDVVVIGYGTQKRKDLTGSVSSISKKDFENQPLADVSQTIKGLAPGVAVSQTSGAPGGEVKIRIRGASSILGNNSPLIVIDGIQSSININELNPNDIESVEILKDASSTAIYGSRGANGVIMITTKRGNINAKAKVEFNSFVSFKNSTDRYDLLNAADYAKTTNRLSPGSYSADEISNFEKNGGTDWQKKLIQTGVLNSNTLTVSGGNAGTSYLFSANYSDEKGTVIESLRKRYTLHTNIQSKVTDRLTIGLNLSASQNNTHNVSSYYTEVWDAVNWSPSEPVFDTSGNYNKSDLYGSIRRNPYMILKESNSDNHSFLGIAGANLSYNIVPGLTFNSILGINYSSGNYGYIANEFINPNISAAQGFYNTTYWQNSNTFTYLKSIGSNHRFSILGGFEQQKTVSKSFNANAANFPTSSVGYNNLGLGSSQSVGSRYSGESLRSYLGRVTYAYKDRYLFTATYRADGSSKFKGKNRYSYFPSAAFAWRLSEVNFIKNMKFFSNLKLRSSWGVTGNQAISPYATLSLLTPFNYTYGTTSSYAGYSIQGAGNPDLRWEETSQLDVGIDAALFDNRVSITADYFKRNTTGLLQATQIPDYNGGGKVIKNIGEIENKGFELALNIIPVQTKNIEWTTTFNFSLIKNKVKSLGDVNLIFPDANEYYVFENPNSHVVKVGESLGSFWGVNHIGIWQQSEATEAAKYGNIPGDNKYEDINGDFKIDGDDKHVIGQSLPRYRWGLNNTIQYKNFTINLFVEAVTGYKVFNGQFASAAVPSSDGRTITLAEGANFWTEQNPSSKYANPLSPTSLNFSGSTQWLQSGNFLRFKNLSIAYNLEKSKIHFANVKFYVSAQNLFTLKKFVGSDPEATVSGASDTFGGYGAGVYPSTRAYTIGLIITN